MKPLLERLRVGLGGAQWLALLTGILVVAVLNLLLTLLLPTRLHAEIWVNVVTAVLAAAVAPRLLRIIDRMQKRVERQNNELRSLHAIDSALNAQLNLQAILEVAVHEATLAVDGELGSLWLFKENDPAQGFTQTSYNINPDREPMITQHLAATTAPDVRRTGLPARRQELDATWSTDRHARLLRLRSTLTVPVKRQDTVLGLLLVANRGGASPLGGFTDEDEALLVATASTLSVAIQNARLYEESQKRGEMLRALVAHTGDAVEASSDARRLMQILADAAGQIVDCPRVAVYALADKSARPRPSARVELIPLALHDNSRSESDSLRDQPQHIPGDRYLLLTGVDDPAGRGARYVPSVAQMLGLPDADAEFFNRPGYLCMLRSRDRRCIGLLCLLDDAPRPQSEDRDAFAQAVAAQAAVGLENALLGEQMQHAYERDRHVAEVFQTSMLPPVPLRIGGFEFANKYQAALEESTLGGDFYDLFCLEDDLYGIVMADVSGKGLKAAVQTAMVKYMLRGFAHNAPHAPGEVLSLVNDVLSSRVTEFEGFVTLFFGVLDTTKGKFSYASAGHEPPLWRDAATNTVIALDDESGLPLGSIGGGAFPSHTRQFQPGDLLLLYTDGLPEARSPQNAFLGTDGLSHFVAQAVGPAQTAVDALHAQVSSFAGDNLRDDVALLLLKRIE